jgi:hypothetical protein
MSHKHATQDIHEIHTMSADLTWAVSKTLAQLPLRMNHDQHLDLPSSLSDCSSCWFVFIFSSDIVRMDLCNSTIYEFREKAIGKCVDDVESTRRTEGTCEAERDAGRRKVAARKSRQSWSAHKFLTSFLPLYQSLFFLPIFNAEIDNQPWSQRQSRHVFSSGVYPRP